MFAELLRAHGFAVSFLGASTPVEHAARLMSRQRPLALAVSCNLALFFGGVTRLAAVAHESGIPVLAGGRALGTDSTRADRLGADAWAAGVEDAVGILDAWHASTPRLRPSVRPDPSITMLDLDAPLVAAEAFDELRGRFDAMAGYSDAQLARTREDLAFIARFAAAASLVDDPTVFTDFLAWLESLLGARGVPARALLAGVEVLAPVVDRYHRASGEFVRSACG
jgi:hypothetical protein